MAGVLFQVADHKLQIGTQEAKHLGDGAAAAALHHDTLVFLFGHANRSQVGRIGQLLDILFVVDLVV
jgi:hypothetical protein